MLKNFILWICLRYNLKVNTIKSDNELGRKKTLRWLQFQSISFKPLAPNTQLQNSITERSGGVIIKKSHVIKIAANLPHDL